MQEGEAADQSPPEGLRHGPYGPSPPSVTRPGAERLALALVTVHALRMSAEPVMGDPGPSGRFGDFGGRYIPETLVMACAELDQAFREAWADPGFRAELDGLLRDYAGRPVAPLRGASGSPPSSAARCC